MKNGKINTEDWKKELKENPFSVPEHYFESFDDRLMAQIDMQAKPQNKPVKIFRILKPVLGVAASLLLVLLLGYYPFTHFFPAYLSGNADKVSAIDSSAFVISNDEQSAQASNEIATESLTTEDMVDYLASELSDYELASTLN